MLLQFSVENYLSFREATVFSMVAAEGVDHPPHVLLEGPGGKKVLRCAAIYGANASGKSNLMKAMEFASGLVRDGRRPGERIHRSPFKLAPGWGDKPSQFDWEIAAGGDLYSYGFQCTTKEILSEWLYRSRAGVDEPVFSREQGRIDTSSPLLSGRGEFVRFVAEGTRSNQLFLTEARERNVRELDTLLRAFDGIQIVRPSSPAGPLFELLRSNESFAAFAGALLHDAGTGIVGVELQKRQAAPDVHAPLGDLSQSALGHQLASGLVDLFPPDGVDVDVITTVHLGADGQLVPFNILDESDGTQRLLQLAPTLHQVETGAGGAIFGIDELERSLHPLIIRSYLSRFLARSAGSQLIFTTHDTNLLDLTLLSADAIWFTEKDPTSATVLYSLAEYRRDQIEQLGPQIEKGYLQGRFGAIPTPGIGGKAAAE